MAEHYFSEQPKSRLSISKILVEFRRDSKLYKVELFTAAGLFSKSALDSATRLLLEKAELQQDLAGGDEPFRILDLGCGYGALGICLKKLYQGIEVWLTDINNRAVKMAKMNAEMHNLEVHIVQADVFSGINTKFHAILVNPPYAAGREVCFRMISASASHLYPGGTLQLVARHTKGGKALSEKMREVFGNMQTLAKRGGFRIYICRQPAFHKNSILAQH